MLARVFAGQRVLALVGGTASAMVVASQTRAALAEPKAPPSEPTAPSPAAAADAGAGPSSAFRAAYDSVYNTVYDNVVAPFAEPSRDKLLPDLPAVAKKPTLVVSLDGTLIESQWTRQFGWRYVKRPGVDDFLTHLAPYYELVLWTECTTAAETVIDALDPRRLLRHRLYRDATTYTNGLHIKDLSHLNRDMDRVVIVDCDRSAFSLQPSCGFAVKPYESALDPGKEDAELTRLIPFLQYLALAARKGTVKPFSEELQLLDVSTTFEDGGQAFEEAVKRRFAELRAQNLLPLQRGRGVGTRNVVGGREGGTLWERLKAARGG